MIFSLKLRLPQMSLGSNYFYLHHLYYTWSKQWFLYSPCIQTIPTDSSSTPSHSLPLHWFSNTTSIFHSTDKIFQSLTPGKADLRKVNLWDSWGQLDIILSPINSIKAVVGNVRLLLTDWVRFNVPLNTE